MANRLINTLEKLKEISIGVSDEIDRFMTVIRVTTVFYDLKGVPDSTILGRANQFLGGIGLSVLALAGITTVAKLAKEQERQEQNSRQFLLYKIMQEHEKKVSFLLDNEVITPDEVNAEYEAFFARLGFDDVDDPESEFYNLQAFLYVNQKGFARNMGRALLVATRLKKVHNSVSFAELDMRKAHFKKYLKSKLTDQLIQPTQGLKAKIEPVNVPDDDPEVELNKLEKIVNLLFRVEEIEDLPEKSNPSKKKLFLHNLHKQYNKVKIFVDNVWTMLGIYSLFYWIAWSSWWLLTASSPALSVATSFASVATLAIPLAPTLIFLVTSFFSRETKEERAARKAKAAMVIAQEIHFAKEYIAMWKDAYQKLHAKRLTVINADDISDEDEDKYDLPVVDGDDIQTALNKKHANWAEVGKHLLHTRFFASIKLGWYLLFKKDKADTIPYQSPTEIVLNRLTSKTTKRRNLALSIFFGFFNGAATTAFLAWPITGWITIGFAAAGGPVGALVGFGIAAAVGVLFSVKEGCAQNTATKQHQQIIAELRPTLDELIAAEKRHEYYRMQLKEGYQRLLVLGADPALFKPTLLKDNLTTDERFYRCKDSNESIAKFIWRGFTDLVDNALVLVGSAETGMLLGRFVMASGGILACLAQLGVMGTMPAAIPIVSIVACAIIYGGTRLYTYSKKKQEERDLAVVMSAEGRLEVVKSANELMEQQLLGQKQYIEVLDAKKTSASKATQAQTWTPRPSRPSIIGFFDKPESYVSISSSGPPVKTASYE